MPRPTLIAILSLLALTTLSSQVNAAASCRALADDELVRVDFSRVDVRPLANLFGCATGRVFVVADDVGEIWLDLSHPEPVRLDQAYAAFLRALFVRGLEIVPRGPIHQIRRIVV